MKKIVYLVPTLLLGLIGKGAMADQNTHISRLDAGFMTNMSQSKQAPQERVVQNKNVKANETNNTTHISSLDSNNIENNMESNVKVAQYNTFSIKTNIKTVTNFTESKVTDGNSDQHTIEDPSNDQITIHYVDENGKSIAGLKDYTININNAPKGNSTGQFKVPDNRYVLPDPTGYYQLQHDKHNVHHNAVTHTVHHPEQGHEETYTIPAQGHYETVTTFTPTYYTNDGEVIGGGDGAENTGNPNTVYGGDGQEHIISDTVWHTSTSQEWVEDSPSRAGTRWVVDKRAWDQTVVDRPAYDETIGSNVFSDNFKNIKSVIGNTVNVILKHGTKNVDIDNSDMELDSWRKVHVINSDNQSNLINKSVKFKVGYTLDLVSLAKIANFNSSKALSDPNDFIGENNLTDPVGFSTINSKLLSISL